MTDEPEAEYDAEAAAAAVDAINDHKDINLGGAMCAGKSTFSEWLGKHGYIVFDDWKAVEGIKALRPKEESKRAAWYAKYWEKLAVTIAEMAIAKAHDVNEPIVVNLWGNPIKAKDWVNIYLTHEDLECIKTQRNWSDPQQHLNDLQRRAKQYEEAGAIMLDRATVSYVMSEVK